MTDRKYYVLCADNCKFESMTKEQIIAAIVQATGKTPTDIDAAFVTKIKELNKGNAVYLWVGTTAEYNALETKRNDCIYIKTDDSATADIYKAIQEEGKRIDEIEQKIEIKKVLLSDENIVDILDIQKEFECVFYVDDYNANVFDYINQAPENATPTRAIKFIVEEFAPDMELENNYGDYSAQVICRQTIIDAQNNITYTCNVYVTDTSDGSQAIGEWERIDAKQQAADIAEALHTQWQQINEQQQQINELQRPNKFLL